MTGGRGLTRLFGLKAVTEILTSHNASRKQLEMGPGYLVDSTFQSWLPVTLVHLFFSYDMVPWYHQMEEYECKLWRLV